MWNILKELDNGYVEVQCDICQSIYKKQKGKLQRDTCKNCKLNTKLDTIEQICIDRNYIFDRNSYVDSRTSAKVTCPQGHISYKRPDNLMLGSFYCNICEAEKEEARRYEASIESRPVKYNNSFPVLEDWWFQKSGKLRESVLNDLRKHNYCYCIRCKEIKNLADFSSISARVCNACKLISKKIKNINNYKKMLEIFGGCQVCGENRMECLDFHHVKEKKILVSTLLNGSSSVEQIQEEMDKCCLLCSNHHMMYHRGRLDIQFKKHPVIGYTVKSYKTIDGPISTGRRLIASLEGFDKCCICGINELSILEFHHVDPTLKHCGVTEFLNNKMTDKTYQNLLNELDKTCCLCRNCHTLFEQKVLKINFSKNFYGYIGSLGN
jgi:hypothetical protein